MVLSSPLLSWLLGLWIVWHWLERYFTHPGASGKSGRRRNCLGLQNNGTAQRKHKRGKKGSFNALGTDGAGRSVSPPSTEDGSWHSRALTPCHTRSAQPRMLALNPWGNPEVALSSRLHHRQDTEAPGGQVSFSRPHIYHAGGLALEHAGSQTSTC